MASRLHEQREYLDTRFIPANAGNRSSGIRFWGAMPVHPRERGEQIRSVLTSTPSIGSSPRTRGTGYFVGRARGEGRFIPANAGNSPIRRPGRCRCTVHPRERGEQRMLSKLAAVYCGSSPRTRGTDERRGLGRRNDRFIPANAGNSPKRGAIRIFRPVHPRERGEQSNVLRLDAP